MLHDTLDSQRLLLLARHGLAVRIARMRPSRLQVVRLEFGADLFELLELVGDEFAGFEGGDAGVEERVDVGGHDVNNAAEGAGVFLKDVYGLGGGDGTGVAGRLEGGFGRGDESREVGHGGVAVEDSFIANDNHFHGGPVTRGPADDGGDLSLRAGNAGVGDVNAEHEFEVVFLGGATDVLQATAVGRVEAD